MEVNIAGRDYLDDGGTYQDVVWSDDWDVRGNMREVINFKGTVMEFDFLLCSILCLGLLTPGTQ